MEIGTRVQVKSDDSVYPRKRATVARLDRRDGKPYLGLEVEQYGVDHVVWRFEEQVEVVR